LADADGPDPGGDQSAEELVDGHVALGDDEDGAFLWVRLPPVCCMRAQ
jgi:hypothetical protein